MPQTPVASTPDDDCLSALLERIMGPEPSRRVLATLAIPPVLRGSNAGEGTATVSRAQVAMALNAALFADLLDRVPTAARYVAGAVAAGEAIVFDHGAQRTIDGPCGALPGGHAAVARWLEPMGYHVGGLYPLPALRMTGRAYVQRDLPEDVPQFFVSELHVDQLPPVAQDAAARVFGGSADPLGAAERAALDALDGDGACTLAQAETIVRGALRAFDRQHPVPALDDYRTLLDHSKEAAWIATEGNAFNHATTRVADVDALAAQLKAAGYPMKEAVEVSQNGRVRQTAILADKVARPFRLADGGETVVAVPGSFYEFITRAPDPAAGTLDLTFDSGNATGIFAVTRDR